MDKPLPSERPTGIGVAAFNMAMALSRRGTAVRLVCRGGSDGTVELDGGLTATTLKHYSRDNLLASISILRKMGSEVTHVHSSAAILTLIATSMLGRPAVWHSHGDEPLHPIRLTLLRNIGMSFSRRVAATSGNTRDRLILQHGIPPGKIVVVYNGVDAEEFKPTTDLSETVSKYGLGGYDKIIVSIGTIQGSKGQAKMIECLPTILRRWPRLVYVNVGAAYDETYFASLVQRARELGISNAVKFLRAVPQSDLVSLINASDLCVHPSTREGFGLAVVEEMACAKTVLAYGVDSIPEIIADRVDGFLFDQVDRESWIESINEILGDPGLRKRIGQAARAKVLAKFTWDQTASHLEELYRELLSR